MITNKINILIMCCFILTLITSGCSQNKEVMSCGPIRTGLYTFGDSNYDLGLKLLRENPGALNYSTTGGNLILIRPDFKYDRCIKVPGNCLNHMECVITEAVRTLDTTKCYSLPTNVTIIVMSTLHGGAHIC